MKTMTRLHAGLVLMAAVAIASHAEELKGISDPTRPPVGVMLKEPWPGADPGAQAMRGAAAAPDAAASAASAPISAKDLDLTLQGIRFNVATGEGIAMINDELLRVGDKVKGMTVVSITRYEAMLKASFGVRRLSLLGDAAEAASEPAMHRKVGSARRGRKEMK